MRKDLLLSPALAAPLASPDLDLHQSPETRNLGIIFALSSCFYRSLVSKSASLHLHYIDRNADLVDLVLAEILFFFKPDLFVSR